MTSPYDYMGQVATPGFELPTSNEFQYGNQTNDPFKILTGQTFNPYKILSQNPYLNQNQSTSITTTTPVADMYTDQVNMTLPSQNMFSDSAARVRYDEFGNLDPYGKSIDPTTDDPSSPDFKPI